MEFRFGFPVIGLVSHVESSNDDSQSFGGLLGNEVSESQGAMHPPWNDGPGRLIGGYRVFCLSDRIVPLS